MLSPRSSTLPTTSMYCEVFSDLEFAVSVISTLPISEVCIVKDWPVILIGGVKRIRQGGGQEKGREMRRNALHRAYLLQLPNHLDYLTGVFRQ
jgi:hypothetical protein